MLKIETLDLLTAKEVAKIMNMSTKTINYNIKVGNIIAITFGNVRRLCRIDIFQEEIENEIKDFITAQELSRLLKVSYNYIVTNKFFEQFLVNNKMRLKRYSVKKIIDYINKERKRVIETMKKPEISKNEIDRNCLEELRRAREKRELRLKKIRLNSLVNIN